MSLWVWTIVGRFVGLLIILGLASTAFHEAYHTDSTVVWIMGGAFLAYAGSLLWVWWRRAWEWWDIYQWYKTGKCAWLSDIEPDPSLPIIVQWQGDKILAYFRRFWEGHTPESILMILAAFPVYGGLFFLKDRPEVSLWLVAGWLALLGAWGVWRLSLWASKRKTNRF